MSVISNSFGIALLSIGILYTAYKLYGTFLARRVFGFNDQQTTPAEEVNDGMDFVPTRKEILFGHHFASIAGLGPILGPAIAVYWGWLPALIWVLAGCVLIGGVHDLAALLASIRHKARSIGDVTNEIIGPRARLLFLIIIFFLLALAMGVFAINMAELFNDLSPQAVVPTFSLIVIAMIIGVMVYRFRWRLLPVTILGVLLMFATTYLGLFLPVPLYRAFVTDPQVQQIITTTDDPDLPQVHGIRATRADKAARYFETRAEKDSAFKPLAENVATARLRSQSTWVYLLLAYALAASVLPVWLLLQPRDYINSFQLYIGLLLLVLGLAVWRPPINAPAIVSLETARQDDAPPVLPFIFITIACGAVSGFHNLVSSGTTARQLRRESDAQIIGYGAMLTEGLLAVLVILACVAGLSREEYTQQYSHWGGLGGRALGAFLTGSGNVVAQPFIALLGSASAETIITFCRNLIAVVVVSFAMTTLDSATRLLRYNVEEIARLARFKPLQNRYLSSFVAVLAIGYFALMRIDGKPAGLTLWQLFGTSNQLLAVLGLLVATVYLYKLGRPIIYTALPMLVMMVSVSWAMALKLVEFYSGWQKKGDVTNLSLLIVGTVLAIMSVWMIVEAVGAFTRARRNRLTGAAPQPAEALTTSEK
ncbi:MAG TPA: carbon starvation protein A [Phycisphaerae bacterium]|jgi:carbon starvation protein|nr:carbon starvation protein A [Phycisphaerae bacterium]HOB75934.1 carbon starvation protein A [Phycisphaerae bacterium]HOJ55540.1 carbon starvation protein A [Phycisphaerae bacterium]HOL27572.1 carbon starvation protein A [Phycisphaerae bacterium]HPP21814.1 carbon starvation protein A [Phycisphaerae bacterium]